MVLAVVVVLAVVLVIVLARGWRGTMTRDLHRKAIREGNSGTR